MVSQAKNQKYWYAIYMNKINFPTNLKNLRVSKGVTQKELAKLLGVDQRTVSAWEKGVCEPCFNTLAKICEFFEEDFNGILL